MNDIQQKLENETLADTMPISGVYKIINKINGKYYVGSSINYKRRFIRHRMELKNNIHPNIYLQHSWNKYGEMSFEFIIVELCSPNDRLMIEQKYLDIAKTEKEQCYNILYLAGKPPELTDERRSLLSARFSGENNPMFGKSHSDLAKERMKNVKLGKYHTKIHNEKISKSLIGNTRAKGYIQTLEHRQKKSNSLKGNLNPRFDFTIYKFKNLMTNENYEGTRYDFIRKYNLNSSSVCEVIHRNKKSVNYWILV